jgi:hypothetical protein
MDTPVVWYCTYCSEAHLPDAGTRLDDRYAIGRCGGARRQLVRSEAEAIRLAESGGKLRPKGVPLGGGQARRQPTTADPVQTKAIQGGSR